MQSTGVYLIHPDGSGLRRLTKVGGFAGSPTWSSDAKRVLYYETDETGAYLAKSGSSRTELVSVDIATGERAQITASNEVKLSPQWLPGGKISYAVRGGNNAGLRIWYPDRRVVTIIPGAIRHGSWSADGKQVVYERFLQQATTEHLIPTASRDPEFELLLTEPFPSYSPDGKTLLYSQYGGNGANVGDTTIETMDADGSGKHPLFHKAGTSAFDAVWAPAGDMIAFCVGRYFRAAGLPSAQIALMKPDGTGYREIAEEGVNNGFPSWSPDGKKLVYKRGKQLVILSIADGKIVPLTDGVHYDNFPKWSPKGDAIMFTTDRDNDFELYTIRPDGTGLRRMTNSPGNDAHSIWSDDGAWVVFSSGRKGFKDEMALYDGVPQPYGEIFAMRADGSDVRQLTDNKWEDASPAGCRNCINANETSCRPINRGADPLVRGWRPRRPAAKRRVDHQRSAAGPGGPARTRGPPHELCRVAVLGKTKWHRIPSRPTAKAQVVYNTAVLVRRRPLRPQPCIRPHFHLTEFRLRLRLIAEQCSEPRAQKTKRDADDARILQRNNGVPESDDAPPSPLLARRRP